MVKTLDELKAENAAAEAAAAEEAQKVENAAEENELDESTQGSDDENEDAEADKESEELEQAAEAGEGKTEEIEAEDWMKGDDHESQVEKKFGDNDMAGLRKKLKAKLSDKEGEIEALKAENEALKNSGTQANTGALTRPKRDDFFDKDEPDTAYDEALTDYIIEKTRADTAAANAANSLNEAEKAAKLKISQGEDAHYNRVAKLVEASGIKPETYQAADLAFRQAIDSALPGNGDNVAAIFMGRLGEGSEKVVYNMLVNQNKLAKLTSLLRDDPTGLDAGMYLAEIKSTVTLPKKTRSSAPKPAPEIKGDASENKSAKSLKKKYLASDDLQERINLRSQARAAGVSTDILNSW